MYLCGVGVVGVCVCVFTCVCIAYCDLTHTEKETEAKGEIVFLFVLFCFGSVKNKSDCFFVVVFFFVLLAFPKGFFKSSTYLSTLLHCFSNYCNCSGKIYEEKERKKNTHWRKNYVCLFGRRNGMEWV